MRLLVFMLLFMSSLAGVAQPAEERVYGAAPDYGELEAVLLRNVERGFVDYDGIAADPAFRRFVVALGDTRRTDLDGPAAELAYLINAYNALAIQGILDGHSPATRRGRIRYFTQQEYRVLREDMTLDEIERNELTPLGEPRRHFAIVCASLYIRGGPGLPARHPRFAARRGGTAFINDGSRNRFDAERRLAFLSPLFASHAEEFTSAGGSLQRYLARYADDAAVAEILAADGFEVRYVEPDWVLNGTRGAGSKRN